MSTPRFYINTEITEFSPLEISGEEARQLIKVLRCKKGDTFKVFNGSGAEYRVIAEKLTKDSVTVKILDKLFPSTEPDLYVVLCQAIPKAQKMDLIVQKATEIGVKEIQPLITERSLKEISPNKLKRLSKISKEAIEQSGRLKPVKVQSPLIFEEVSNIITNDDLGILFCCRGEERSFKSLLKSLQVKGKIFLLIGPEGDFTEKEVNLFKNNNHHIASLGSRILRTETSGLVALSNIFYELEK